MVFVIRGFAGRVLGRDGLICCGVPQVRGHRDQHRLAQDGEQVNRGLHRAALSGGAVFQCGCHARGRVAGFLGRWVVTLRKPQTKLPVIGFHQHKFPETKMNIDTRASKKT